MHLSFCVTAFIQLYMNYNQGGVILEILIVKLALDSSPKHSQRHYPVGLRARYNQSLGALRPDGKLEMHKVEVT